MNINVGFIEEEEYQRRYLISLSIHQRAWHILKLQQALARGCAKCFWDALRKLYWRSANYLWSRPLAQVKRKHWMLVPIQMVLTDPLVTLLRVSPSTVTRHCRVVRYHWLRLCQNLPDFSHIIRKNAILQRLQKLIQLGSLRLLKIITVIKSPFVNQFQYTALSWDNFILVIKLGVILNLRVIWLFQWHMRVKQILQSH